MRGWSDTPKTSSLPWSTDAVHRFAAVVENSADADRTRIRYLGCCLVSYLAHTFSRQ
jgi:hypothetical protein